MFNRVLNQKSKPIQTHLFRFLSCQNASPNLSFEVEVDKLQIFEGFKQPKISLTYGHAIHKLKKCRDQIFSKYFKETFSCKVKEGIDFFEVGLWKRHRYTFDELVGSQKVQLPNVTSEKFYPFTTQLFSDDSRFVGDVQLKIRLVQDLSIFSMSSMTPSKPLLPSVSPTMRRVLPGGLPDLRGTEIPSHVGDIFEFNLEGCITFLKEIDAYISMKYGDVEYKSGKSTVVFMYFLDGFTCKADEAIKVLDINLWKRHRIFYKELVGSAKIKLDNVPFGDFHCITTELFSKDGRCVGQVGLKLRHVKPSPSFFKYTKQ